MTSAHPNGFYQSVFEHSMEAVFLTSPDGTIFAANPAACSLFGYSESEMLLLGRSALIDSSGPAFAGFLEQRRHSGRARGEFEGIRADGGRFPVEVSSEQFSDDQDSPRTIMIVRDLTERKRTEQELIESQVLLGAIINSTADLIWSVDAETLTLVWFNRAFSEYFWAHHGVRVWHGMGAEDLFLQQREVLVWRGLFLKVLEDGVLSTEYTSPINGIVLQLNLSLLKRDGKVFGISAFGRDITELRRSEQKIADYVRQLENSMQQTLLAVANMVEMRDPYTSGHERRVGIIAGDIARELGWPEEKCRNLELIATVHDIGKIAIPGDILTKPSRLTPIEYKLVQSHVERGYEILKDVDFPLPIAEIIYEHHERMDGSGYPRGLKGDQIRPEARILAVADVLESMASHRPYRPALGMDTAIREIEEHRGTWFDPVVVDAILRMIREKGYSLPT
ncbi:PAS domain S-box-containing protein/putative nucleotidyltransferase with HDIG domain [Fluviicoccus keumensis]|uniref:PAS domain S-box-containing protein/putative nucleotidyltransferase with HDIG domain n=1 Tax=Fluviicoccus keumensis TaxID=1435465 RepID=A0A4V2G639_9GAMM|nr:HD domain-containing phosphohydrolase [Fluviicoccus keumensis]RZU47196.1 PAS domain S-box-containing protein/putative nucleotidyltransferase with HDIG domain [Fluviicoccus keumensis]